MSLTVTAPIQDMQVLTNDFPTVLQIKQKLTLRYWQQCHHS